MNNVTTIEDLLEYASNLRSMPLIKLESSDMTIMHSIGRQVFKGTALTDRQLALMQEKLTHYKDQFINLEIDFDLYEENIPLILFLLLVLILRFSIFKSFLHIFSIKEPIVPSNGRTNVFEALIYKCSDTHLNR